MSTKLLQSSHLEPYLTSKTSLNDLELALTLAEQIVLKTDTKFPEKTQLAHISYGQFSVLKQLWQTAIELNPELQWHEFIRTLKSLITEAQNHVVTVTISYQPTVAQAAELSELLKKQLHEAAVLDLAYDPNLIAGCLVASNGKQLDYSLAAWLPQYLAKVPPTP